MEITSQGSANVSDGGAYKSLDESECVTNQPKANGMLPNHSEESPPCSDRLEEGDSGDEGLIENPYPDDISRLLPLSHPSKNKDSISEDRALPSAVCTPPSPSIPPSLHPLPLSPSVCPEDSVTSSSSSSPPPLQSTPCNRHLPHHHRQRDNQKRLSSGAKSHASLKTNSAHHIKEVARDDCCAHCVLACLFCEVLSMCSVLGDCLACGGSGIVCCDAAGCCCCCAEAVGDMACTEEACQAVLDCGIMEDCCGSSDCLECCLECCSICFPA